MIDHRAHGLGGVAVAPIRNAEPIADLGGALARLDAADADRLAAERDDERSFACRPVDRRNESLGILGAIGMRNARGILRDAAVVGETHNSFDVAATRRAQYQPLGFENGNAAPRRTAAPEFPLRRLIVRAPAKKPKGGAGIPVSPLSEPNRVRRFDWMPADLI